MIMKVKFKQSVAGVDFVFGAGEVKDLPASEAAHFIRVGYADAVDEKDEEPPKAKRPLKAKAVHTRPVNRKK